MTDHTSSTSDRMTADGDSTVNSTNLAIKGIIAIKAMAQISTLLEQMEDADEYTVSGINELSTALYLIRTTLETTATNYAKTWKSLALPSNAQQILSSYGAPTDSYALPYNLFADKWLGTEIIDSAVSIFQREHRYPISLIISDVCSGDRRLAGPFEF